MVLRVPVHVLLALLPGAFAGSDAPDTGGEQCLVSRCADGRAALGLSGLQGLSLSADGRQIAFESEADGLVPGDDNHRSDVFLSSADAPLRLLSGVGGRAVGGPSLDPALSGNGAWAAFTSFSRELAAGDEAPWGDVFLVELAGGARRRISCGPTGEGGHGNSARPALSHDGRRVVFQSFADDLVPGDTNGLADIFLYERESGSLRRLSVPAAGGEADGDSSSPAISGDGRLVSFSSSASNLVPGDDNGVVDVFCVEVASGRIERINLGPGGVQADAPGGIYERSGLSFDGRFVVFVSLAAGLDTPPADPWCEQIYVRDRQLGLTRRVSVGPDDAPADDLCACPSISADGRQVLFLSRARNLDAADGDAQTDLFLRDLDSGSTRLLSHVDDAAAPRGDCELAALSADGSAVLYAAHAPAPAPDAPAAAWKPGTPRETVDVVLLRMPSASDG